MRPDPFERGENPVKDRCGPTGKVRYRTQYAANQSLTERRVEGLEQGYDRRRERRAYFCIKCNGWHLTSEPRIQRVDGEVPL